MLPIPDDAELDTRLAGTTRFGRLVHLPECRSTQDLALAAEAGDAVFWADHQTHGRGRQLREWHDEPGADLAVSLRVAFMLPNPLALSAAAPLCVLRSVEPVLGRKAGLKWPNDVMVDGRKLAGVLIDAGGGGPDGYAIGIGINCNRVRFPRDLEPRATSLALLCGREIDRRALLLELAQQLERALQALERGDEAELAASFADRLGLLGRRVEVVAARPHRGTLARLDCRELTLADGTKVPLGQVTALTPIEPG